MRLAFLLVLVALVAFASAAYPKCDTTLSVGTTCYIKASRVKPTQFAYGRIASTCKAQYLQSMSSSKLDKYLTKYVTATVASDGRLEKSLPFVGHFQPLACLLIDGILTQMCLMCSYV